MDYADRCAGYVTIKARWRLDRWKSSYRFFFTIWGMSLLSGCDASTAQKNELGDVTANVSKGGLNNALPMGADASSNQ
ncbi:hypothetical protein [Sphingobium yanoikuyae]|uniref:hypothetical protein n=1 Tax=Sphingobium yanoikuyae TaxID=13690 RepID=UPI0022DDB521|nr:hypothetical protein [Sphingobium yanoikuyae]WBQ19023.1 hypothetical protein PAE53_24605 [Sphingobium yanoikuyae]